MRTHGPLETPCVQNEGVPELDRVVVGSLSMGTESMPPHIRILGTPVHMVQIPDVVGLTAQWLAHERSRTHWIVVADMHAVIEAHKRPDFGAKLVTADLIVPDGISLVKVARRKGVPLRGRVTGTDLMKAVLASQPEAGLRHFFFGDTEETLARLSARVRSEFPHAVVAGTCSPPFRPVTPDEDAAMVRLINESRPDVLWVGLGLPKQEQWIYDHRAVIDVPLVLGVGAAFKFLAGTVRRAPDWVGDWGFEWLWRLAHEPRRLWRRILIEGPQFVGHVLLELSGLRTYT